MPNSSPLPRRFLFLQGPHGPFYARLARALRGQGVDVWRIGFNGGDRVFWDDRRSYIPYRGDLAGWPDFLRDHIARLGITDLVIYNDTRGYHKTAVEIARAVGLRIHVFEEGYIRPYWVTYERDGSNGHSRLMDLDLAQIRAAAPPADAPQAPPPAHWGDMRQHMFYGALYHFCVLLGRPFYPRFRGHRALGLGQEFALYASRILRSPLLIVQRWARTRRLLRSSVPYHVVLMQLEHDTAFQEHSPFSIMPEFIDLVLQGFAAGAPAQDHLVFKAHPLENGRWPLDQLVATRAAALCLTGRVHVLPGGKLAPLMAHAKTAVTVNSTAAHQALWRAVPLKIFGAAIYDKLGFVSAQDLPAFFAAPTPPDMAAYHDFRAFLLSSSQHLGGFYAARGRARLSATLPQAMLAAQDPYQAALANGGRTQPKG